MELSRKKSLTASVFAFAFPALILLIGISAFGIWDPWELATADEARQFSLGRDVELTRAPLRARLIGIAFKVFGVHEWSGRTPMVLCGLLALGAGYLLAKRFSDTRTAAYAAIVAGTTPIFLFNSRQMLGHSIGFAAQALIALTAASAVFFPTASDDEAKRRNTSILWLVGLIAAVTMVCSPRARSSARCRHSQPSSLLRHSKERCSRRNAIHVAPTLRTSSAPSRFCSSSWFP